MMSTNREMTLITTLGRHWHDISIGEGMSNNTHGLMLNVITNTTPNFI